MTTAIVYTEFGGPEVLHLLDVAEQPPGPGELRVRIEAAGVNPIDAKLRAGLRASDPIVEPRRVGGDAAGIVVEVGEGVEGFHVGSPVALFGAVGAYATEVTVPARAAALRPAAVSPATAAGLGVPVGAAYQTLRSLAVGAGDTLLWHGGSGAVGQAAIQLAVLWGARVIATTSAARADRVRALGAEPVEYGDGLADRVRGLAHEGVTVAVDGAGTDEALRTSLDLVLDRDRIATIVRGKDADALGIRAFSGGSPRPLTETQQAWRAEAVPVALGLLAAGAFSVELGPVLPLADAAQAHRLVAAGTPGKITLVP